MTEPAIIIDPDLVAEIERLSDDTLDEAKSPDNFAKSSLAESTLTGPSQADSTLAGPSLAGPSLAGPSLAGPSPAGPSIGEPSPAGHLWSSDEPFPQSSQDNPPTPGYEGPLAADMRPPTTEHDLAALALDRMAALTYLTDRDNALAFSLDTALKLIPSVAGAILIYDPAPSQLYLAVARGPSQPNPLGFRVPVGEGLAGFCAMNGLPLSLSHVDEDQRFHTALSSHFGISVSSIMGAPIQYEGRFYGVLELVNRQPEGPYLAEELNALACIAWQLAQRLATALAV